MAKTHEPTFTVEQLITEEMLRLANDVAYAHLSEKELYEKAVYYVERQVCKLCGK